MLRQLLAIAERTDELAMLLERSVSLARREGAHIDLFVTEPSQMGVVAPLCAARGFDEVNLRSVYRGSEPLADVILRCVQSGAYDLVVKTAAHVPGDQSAVDEADWRLARECPVPVFIVRGDAWAASARLAVTIDVHSAAQVQLSRQALETAGLLALGCRANLDVLCEEPSREDDAATRDRASRVEARRADRGRPAGLTARAAPSRDAIALPS